MPFFSTTALTVMSIGMTAAGAFGEAQDRKNTANYNSEVQLNNAEIAAVNAADIRDRGEQAAQDRGARTRQVIGAAKASMAGNGVLVDDGAGTTSRALLDDLAKAGAIDILRMRENAAREEYRALVQGSNFEAQAGLFDMQANSINPVLAGFSAGLRGASNNADTLFS